MKLYHYSNVKFDQIDMSKCDGFWMTDIAPDSANTEVIGVDSVKYCYVCEVADDLDELINGSNYDVEEQLDNEGAKIMVNHYDGFSDYAVSDSSLVKIIEVIEM